jgi:hypothetical protein
MEQFFNSKMLIMPKFQIGQSVCDKKDGEIVEILDYSEKTGYYITDWMGSVHTYLEDELIEPENYVEPEEQVKEDKLNQIIEKLDLILGKIT